MRVPRKNQDNLDCLESDSLFAVIQPGGSITRDDFADLRPLLRQALVAGAAALETYVADKAMEFVGPALRSDDPPPRLLDIPLSVGRWREIEEQYKRKGWGLRNVVEESFRETSSPAPSQIGIILSSIGVSKWAKKVDGHRKASGGTTVIDLERIAARRNRIAHSGDRVGQGRAQLGTDEVANELVTIRSIAHAIETMLENHTL